MTAIAIGITRPSAPAVKGVLIEKVASGIALVMDARGMQRSPLERLQLCADFHARHPAFLPFSPRSPVRHDAAWKYAHGERARLERRLEYAGRQIELRLSIAYTPPPDRSEDQASSGRAWLDARRTLALESERMRSMAERWLETLIKSLHLTPLQLASRGEDVTIACHISPADLGTTQRRLSDAAATLTPCPVTKGALLVTGPWPLFALHEREYCP